MPGQEQPGLLPYVARLHAEWHQNTPDQAHRRISGTLVFADISGFTALTERLARKGKVGAEEMSDTLNAVFTDILEPAYDDGADLVKWGGDAVLLLFTGDLHEARACRASSLMRSRLRVLGTMGMTAGRARLRMSVGVHSGDFECFLVGDPMHHRELLVSGPEVSVCARLEAVANAGEIAISDATAAAVGSAYVGRRVEGGVLLKGHPEPSRVARIGRQRIAHDLQALLPVEIRHHLLLGDPEPEHRDIAVAFVKFSGTDEMALREGPDAVADALHDVIVNVSRATAEHGVTFFETDIDADGGKIMLAAGVPTSAGHDGERLLRACRKILDNAGRLPLKIGANFGHVFSGDFGPPFRRTYSIKGDAINLAARVMGKAKPGELLATEAVMVHSATDFEVTQLEPFAVKGKTEPVHAVSVGAVLAVRHEYGVSDTPLTGRGEEMRTLTRAVEMVSAGRGSIVQIVGEPGIGKSRLMSETARVSGFPVLEVPCIEYETSTPYYPFQVMVEQLLGITARTEQEVRLSALVESAAARKLGPWLPLVGDLLDIPVPPTPQTADLDDLFRQRKTQDVVLDLLTGLLREPTLITVDDAHFMDGASCLLLDRLIERLATEPWLVVVSRRDIEDGWQPGEGIGVQTLRPQRLTDDESIALVQRTTGARPLPRALAKALAERAAGNPFFLQSLIHAADPTGRIDDLPESVGELLTTQIDQLPPEARLVLRRASVLGERFDTEFLEGLFDHAPEGSVIDELADFLVPDGPHGLRFRHALIREVAYEGLPYRQREQLHGRIADLLEREYGADARSLELLAVHSFHARRFERAFAYSLQAGQVAKEMYALTEAAELYSRAVECHRRGATVDRAQVADVLTELGDCWFTMGLADPAETAYLQAGRLVRDDLVRAADLVWKLAWVDQSRRRFPHSLRRLTRGIRALEGVEGAGAHEARSRLFTGYAKGRWSQGRLRDAIDWSTRALEEALLGDDRDILATAYGNLHGFHLAAGEPTPEPYGLMALELYGELGDLSGQAHTTNNLAVEAQNAYRWVEAGEMYEQAARMFATIGDTAREGDATYNRGEVLVDQGRYLEAIPLLEHALVSARSASDDELTAYALRQIGRAWSGAGNIVGGLENLEQARAMFLSIDEDNELTQTDLCRAVGLLLDGDDAAVLRVTDTLLVDADDELEASVRWVRGFTYLEAGERGKATHEFQLGRLAAEAAEAVYARALNCLGLGRCGGVQAEEWETSATLVLESLGVAGLPLPTVPGLAAT